MASQIMEMTATVVDRSTGPLAKIQQALVGMSRTGGREVQTLNQGVEFLQRNLRSAAIPALQAFGISSLSLTGTIGGLSIAMKGFARDAVALKFFSEDTRLSVGELEKLRSVANALGFTGLDQAVRTFASHMLQLRGSTRGLTTEAEELRRILGSHGRLDLYGELSGLSKIKDNTEALGAAKKALAEITQADLGQVLSTRLFGTPEMWRVAREEAHTLAMLPAQVLINIEAAKKLNDQMSILSQNFGNIKTTISNNLYEPLTKWIGEFNSFLDKHQGAIGAEIVAFFRDAGREASNLKQIWDELAPTVDPILKMLASPGMGNPGLNKEGKPLIHDFFPPDASGKQPSVKDAIEKRTDEFIDEYNKRRWDRERDQQSGSGSSTASSDPKTKEDQKSWWRSFLDYLHKSGLEVLQEQSALPANAALQTGGVGAGGIGGGGLTGMRQMGGGFAIPGGTGAGGGGGGRFSGGGGIPGARSGGRAGGGGTPGTPSAGGGGVGSTSGGGVGGMGRSIPGYGRPGGGGPGGSGDHPQGEASGGGSAYLAQKRAALFADLDKNPALQKEIGVLLSKENWSPKGRSAVLESMVNDALRLGHTSLSQKVHSGFYGPVNSGDVARDVAAGEAEKEAKATADAIAKVRGGSDEIEQRTDQGMYNPAKGINEHKGRTGIRAFSGEHYSYHDEAYSRGELAKKRTFDAAAVDKKLLQEGGPGGAVRQFQGSVAGIRKGAIGEELAAQLRYAGGETGLDAEITSGGQPRFGRNRTGSHRHDEGGAGDMMLRDPKTGKLLDMSDPVDAARMKAYVTQAVRAGATGVGAGRGYMGDKTLHIGGGNQASWGGAPWIADALKEGSANRLSPAQVAAANNERLNKALAKQTSAAKVEGSAKVDVTVGGGNPIRSRAHGAGLFKPVETNRSSQMPHSSDKSAGSTDSAGGDEE